MRPGRTHTAADPRVVVALFMLAALVVVGVLAVVLRQAAESAGDSVLYVRAAVGAPIAFLGEAVEANSAGEVLLTQAAATVGDERNALLGESIAAGEAATKAWTSYRAVSLPLAGEERLAGRYEHGYAVSKEIAEDVLVPIIQSNQPEALPQEQILAAQQNLFDLRELIDLYEREAEDELRSLEDRLAQARQRILAVAAAAATIIVLSGIFTSRIARRVLADRRARGAAAETAAWEAQLNRALELVDDDAGVFRVAARAVSIAQPDATVAVLASDASGARLSPVEGLPACGIDAPARCPALRAGALLQFHDSTSLDACPILAAGAAAPCSTTCLPVSIAGADAALIQLVGPPRSAPEIGERLSPIVRRVGERLALLRAVAGLQVQASRDSLTGLLNRRSYEASVAELRVDGIPYSIAFADLDHFKELNDVQGHDAGDRALRAFARTLRDTLRPEDLLCRWGGEEFVAALPHCAEAEAVEIMERVRARLASLAREGSGTAVRVSCGVAEAGDDEPLEETVERADRALREAKAAGRDRVVAWTARAGGSDAVVV